MNMQEMLLQAGLSFSNDVIEQMNRYHALLMDWNTRMDLTSVTQEEMASRHFLDSLAPLLVEGLFPSGARLIDVGTGAGFPGLPLAIARPDMQVTLLDAQGKRCTFLSAVCTDLKLSNVQIIHERAEVLGREEKHRAQYDLGVARAVAPLNILCEYLLPFVKVGGQAVCWKGPAVLDEQRDGAAAAALLGAQLAPLIEMTAAGAQSRHVLAIMTKTEDTPALYPRKNGIPAKRPLKADKN